LFVRTFLFSFSPIIKTLIEDNVKDNLLTLKTLDLCGAEISLFDFEKSCNRCRNMLQKVIIIGLPLIEIDYGTQHFGLPSFDRRDLLLAFKGRSLT
jgi:hypothetical protein